MRFEARQEKKTLKKKTCPQEKNIFLSRKHIRICSSETQNLFHNMRKILVTGYQKSYGAEISAENNKFSENRM